MGKHSARITTPDTDVRNKRLPGVAKSQIHHRTEDPEVCTGKGSGPRRRKRDLTPVARRLQSDPDDVSQTVREHRGLDTSPSPIGNPGVRGVAPLGKEAVI